MNGCELYVQVYTVCMSAKLLQSCLTLCNPVDYSPPGSSVHRILQTRIWSGLPCPLHNRILLRHEKEWDFAIDNNMDGFRGYYA